MSSSRPNVLFATRPLHHPPIGGPTLRIENSIKALSQISNLHLYSRAEQKSIGGPAAVTFYEQYCKAVYFAPFRSQAARPQSRVQSLVSRIRQRVGGNGRIGNENGPEEDFDYLLKVAGEIKADVIWLGYGNIAYSLLKYLKRHSSYKVVVDTDSVWSKFILRGLPYARTDTERQKIMEQGNAKEDEERQGTQLADVTTAVSEVDAEYYRPLAKDPRQIHIFSNVIDLDVYRQPESLGDTQNIQKPCMFLAGTFWPNSPMEDAARWVLEHVLPLVQREIPDVHFYIVGQGSDRILKDVQDPAVTVTGQLPSVLPYLLRADVALVPLRFESGTRFKILEAGACKIPIVSTTLGAEGLTVRNGEHLLLADEPEAFAAAIVRLIRDRDLADRVRHNLYELVANHYSLSVLAKEGEHILNYLLS